MDAETRGRLRNWVTDHADRAAFDAEEWARRSAREGKRASDYAAQSRQDATDLRALLALLDSEMVEGWATPDEYDDGDWCFCPHEPGEDARHATLILHAPEGAGEG